MQYTKTFFALIISALTLTACAPFHPAPSPLPEITSCGNAKMLITNLTVKKTTRQYMTESGRMCLPEATE